MEDMPLSRAFIQARVIVCTYPQTTFSEAMLTGIPTLMFFDPEVCDIHPVGRGLMRTLEDARIVFSDPKSAAEHLCEVWDDTETWWNGAETQRARDAFLETTMNQQRWPLVKWAGLLRGLVQSS